MGTVTTKKKTAQQTVRFKSVNQQKRLRRLQTHRGLRHHR